MTYYFAYGSNVDLHHRWEGLRKVARAWLPDRRVAFTRHSTGWEGGVLDVVPTVGALASGILFEVTRPEVWDQLDEKEGVPNAYQHLDTLALTRDGGALPVRTYEVREREPFVEPAPRYLAHVREAWGEDEEALRALSRAAENRPANPETGVFVYGTLMRGESRWTAIARHRPGCALLAEAWGSLYDLGEFPAMTSRPEARRLVHGDFVRIPRARMAELLEDLDQIEGFRGFGISGSLFERRLMTVGIGEGRVRRAWGYVMPEPLPEAVPIVSADWRGHRGSRQAFLRELAAAHAEGLDERELARHLLHGRPFGGAAGESTAQAAAPLASALEQGDLSERKLAQATGRWVVVPGPHQQ